MRILIVTQYYFPEQFLINEVAERLVKLGHNVTVLTGLPNYPSGKIPNKYRFFRNRNELINGVKVVRVSMIGRGSTLKMIFNALTYMIFASLRILTIGSHDVIYSYQMTPVTQVVPAIIYKKMYRRKLYIYVCDLAPASGEKRFKNRKLIKYFYYKFSKWIYQSADMIGVTSKSFIEYMQNKHEIDIDKIKYLPQHGSDYMMHISSHHLLSSEKVNLLFAGNIGYGQNLQILVKVCLILIKQEIKNFIFNIVGDGAFFSTLKNLVIVNHLTDYFVFNGYQNKMEMPKYYKNANALILTLRKSNDVGLTIPSKLQTYLTVGKPIFGSIDGPAYDIINENKLGVCSPADDEIKFAEILAQYIKNPADYKYMGDNSFNFFLENFTLDKHISDLISQLNILILL